jgi:serine/threonine protein kinase
LLAFQDPRSAPLFSVDTYLYGPTSGKEVGPYSYVSTLKSGALRGSWKAINKETQEFYAIKSINKVSFTTSEQTARFSKEIGLLKRANNRYIAALIDFIDEPQTYHLVSELPEGCSLRDYIEKNGPMSDKLVKELLSKLQYVLIYISTELCLKYVIVNPDVIFVDENGNLDRFILQDEESILAPPSHFSCICFTPPELLSRQIKHVNSNSWSIGILTYYALTGKIPFLAENEEGTTKHILGSHLTYPDSFPDDTRKFIAAALTKNPLMRLPIKDIFSTEFMHGINPEVPLQAERRKSAISRTNYMSLNKRPISGSPDDSHPKLSAVHLSYKSNIGAMKHSSSRNKLSGTTLG